MDRKEAIEVIKKNYPHVGFSGSEFESALRELVPELHESDDERIRKAIEGTIRVYGKTQGEWLCGYDMDTLVVHLREAFGALEKQKEQKPVEIHIDNPNIQKYDDVKISTSDSSVSGDELLYVCNKSYNIGFRDGVASVKPAEHPEKGNEYWFGFNEGKGTVLDNPEQFGLYKPAEWSEEDEKMFTDISWAIRYCRYDDKRKERLNDYLKTRYLHLRPQPHWKPSEEQMTNLINVRNHVAQASGHWGESLSSLIDDLQKL